MARQPPGSLRHGIQPLHSTAGPFSVLSAILGSINHGQDTVLTLWKRAEAYLQFAWTRADCYPAHRLGLHTIRTNLDAYRDTRSLSLISGLRLPYTPSLLEVFQRCSTPRLHPVVLYYILAGASSVHAEPWISALGYPRYRNYPWIIRYG